MDNKMFLILEKTTNPVTKKKIIGFASPLGLEILGSSKQWGGDGTFNIAKVTLFSQVFIISAKTQNGINVPCGFFMLPDKELETYKMMFNALLDLNIAPPSLFYCDFESGIIKGMRSIYPETKIRCCDTHFKRALRTNLQHHHLIELYNKDASFQTFIRHLWALSLVPTSEVIKVWDEIIVPLIPNSKEDEEDAPTWDADEDDVNDFINYFESTWLGTMNWRTNMRKNPRYRHELWSKYDAVRSSEDTTTNSCEGFNNAIQLSVPHNASMWAVIHQFKTEESLVHVKLRDAAVGNTPDQNKRRTLNRVARMQELRHLVNSFETIPLKEYVGYIIDFYNHSVL